MTIEKKEKNQNQVFHQFFHKRLCILCFKSSVLKSRKRDTLPIPEDTGYVSFIIHQNQFLSGVSKNNQPGTV